jgi:hypothetical protein
MYRSARARAVHKIVPRPNGGRPPGGVQVEPEHKNIFGAKNEKHRPPGRGRLFWKVVGSLWLCGLLRSPLCSPRSSWRLSRSPRCALRSLLCPSLSPRSNSLVRPTAAAPSPGVFLSAVRWLSSLAVAHACIHTKQ